MNQRILPALIRAIGNTQNYAAQKAACLVIAQMSTIWPSTRTYLTNAMPNEWVQELLTRPNQFCLQMTPTQIDTFQGAEPSNFFFDSESTSKNSKGTNQETTVQSKVNNLNNSIITNENDIPNNEEEEEDSHQKPTLSSVQTKPQIVMRPTALKYIPVSMPKKGKGSPKITFPKTQ